MQQLKMYWKNDNSPAKELKIPTGCRIVNFPNLPNAMEKWLDIVQYGLSAKREDASYYKKIMTDWACYEEDKCFFILEGEEAVATVTVVCDYPHKSGYVHMVACKEGYRGKGYGTLLNDLALKVLKEEGMTEARLTTDDWRIPAIRSYLRGGFYPDVSTDDYKERWAKIYEQIDKGGKTS